MRHKNPRNQSLETRYAYVILPYNSTLAKGISIQPRSVEKRDAFSALPDQFENGIGYIDAAETLQINTPTKGNKMLEASFL